MRKILALALLLLGLPAQAQELATLRPFATVEDAVVRVSDLFEGAGLRAGAVLGPAPAPGQRQVIEAAQLAAIARQQGIAWRPVGGADRVVLERPGRPVAREEVMALLRAALRAQGLDEEAEIELSAFAPPLVPMAAFVQMAVEQATLDAPAGRFAATLAVAVEGMPTARLRLGGRVIATQPMLVAARRMAIGEVVGPRDVRVIRVPASRLRPGAADRPEQVVGQALRRPAMAEQPLLVADVAQPVAVERGATVTMLYEVPGMVLTAQGRVLEAAGRGAMVPVMNLASRVVIEAQVIGPGRVRVGAPR
jgi:flagella basal body P-ring formation protein FlgA